ncbi:MAG: hypothetical protein AB1775_09795 [Bacteroidota bacterium]
MKIERKALLLGLGIFLTGLIVGVIVGGTIIGRYQKSYPVVPATKKEFKSAVTNIISPTDKQMKLLLPCIDSTSEKIVETNVIYREKIISLIDTMYNCFKDDLTDDQKIKFRIEFNRLVEKHNKLKEEGGIE